MLYVGREYLSQGKLREAVIFAAMCFGALLFVNLDEFASFKGGPIEARLREAKIATQEAQEATAEAEVRLEELKNLGLSLAGAISDEMAVAGQMMKYIPVKFRLERTNAIAGTMRELGASKDEIEQALHLMYARVHNNHVAKVLWALRQANPEKEALFEEFSRSDSDVSDWGVDEIADFISEHDLDKGDEFAELMADFEFYLETRELRRPELWEKTQ